MERSFSEIKGKYKDYEFSNLFDEIDIVRDGQIAKSELKFFLKKQEWYHLSPQKIKKRQLALEEQLKKEREWFKSHHPKMA